MTANILLDMELWSGFFGTLIGAVIGGLTAYFIAKYQFNIQEKKTKLEIKQKKKDNKFSFYGKFI